MKIDTLILGDYQTNSYVLRVDESATDCLIVDTGLGPDPLLDFLNQNNLTPTALILTHGHADHIYGIPPLRKEYPHIKVYIHPLDAEMLTRASKNLSLLAGSFFKTDPADCLIEEPDVIDLAQIKLEVFNTPGHTPGGVCLYSKTDGVVFVGDTLFADSVGRTDFQNGDMDQLIKGIKTKLCTLPGDTKVYPGHGPATTIAQEKAYNQYLQ